MLISLWLIKVSKEVRRLQLLPSETPSNPYACVWCPPLSFQERGPPRQGISLPRKKADPQLCEGRGQSLKRKIGPLCSILPSCSLLMKGQVVAITTEVVRRCPDSALPEGHTPISGNRFHASLSSQYTGYFLLPLQGRKALEPSSNSRFALW